MNYNEIFKKLSLFSKIDKLKNPEFDRGSPNQTDMTEQFYRNMGYDENTVNQIEESIENSKQVSVWEDVLLKQDDFIDTVNFYMDSLDQKQIKDVVDLVMCCTGYYGQLFDSFGIAQNKIKDILQDNKINLTFDSNENQLQRFTKQTQKFYESENIVDNIDGILIKSLEEQYNNRDGENVNILNHTKNFFDGQQVQQYRENLDNIISVLESLQKYLDLSSKVLNSLYFDFEVPDIISIVIQLQIIQQMNFLQDMFIDNSPNFSVENNKFQFYLEQAYQTLYSCDSSDSLENMIDLSRFENLLSGGKDSTQPMIIKLTNLLFEGYDENVIKDSTMNNARQFDSQLKDLNSFTNNELNLQLQKNLCNQCTVIPGVLGGIGSVIQQVVDLMQEMLNKALNTIMVKVDKNTTQFKFQLFIDFSSQIIDSLITMFDKMKFDNIESLFDLDFDKCMQIFEEEVNINLDKQLNIDIFDKLGLDPTTMQTDPNDINDQINEGYYTGNDLFDQFNSLFKNISKDEKEVKIVLKDKTFTTKKNKYNANINFQVYNKTNGSYNVFIKLPNQDNYKVFYNGDIIQDKTNKQDNMVNVKVPEPLEMVIYEQEEYEIFIKLQDGTKSQKQVYYCDFENRVQDYLKVDDYSIKVSENSQMKMPIVYRLLQDNKDKKINYKVVNTYGFTLQEGDFISKDQTNTNYNIYKYELDLLQYDYLDEQPIHVVLEQDKRYEFKINILKQAEDGDNPITSPIDELPETGENPENEEQDDENIVNFINEAIKKQSESDSLDFNSINKFIGKNKSYYDIQKRINDIKEV